MLSSYKEHQQDNNVKNNKLEEHSVERINSDKRRYPTAQLICVFVVLDL